MTFQRACAFVLVAIAAAALSGCFVLSKRLPAGKEFTDERLVGAWQGFDEGEQKKADAFLHFLEPDRGEPLKLVWVEGRSYQVYEVHTFEIAGRNVFASKPVTPIVDGGEMPEGFFLGFYEVRGDDKIVFAPLDAEKIRDMIKSGKLKGDAGKGKYDFALLTGSPAELAAFLASPEAQEAGIDDPAVLHRLR